MFQPTLAFLELTLNILGGTGGALDPTGIWAGLYQVGSSVGPGMVFEDLTEATYDGYDRIQLEEWTASWLSGGKPTIQGGSISFVPDGDSISNNIGGYFLIDTATDTGNIRGYEPFAPTVTMASELNRVTIEPRLTLDQLANYGAAGVQR